MGFPHSIIHLEADLSQAIAQTGSHPPAMHTVEAQTAWDWTQKEIYSAQDMTEFLQLPIRNLARRQPPKAGYIQ